jgi:hypothetical protein
MLKESEKKRKNYRLGFVCFSRHRFLNRIRYESLDKVSFYRRHGIFLSLPSIFMLIIYLQLYCLIMVTVVDNLYGKHDISKKSLKMVEQAV